MELYQRRWWSEWSGVIGFHSLIFILAFLIGIGVSINYEGLWWGIPSAAFSFLFGAFIVETISRKRLQNDLDTLERRTNAALSTLSDETLREMLRTSAQKVEQVIEEQNGILGLRTADYPHPEKSGDFQKLRYKQEKAEQNFNDVRFLLSARKMNPPNSYQEAVRWGLPESQDEKEEQEPSYSGTI